MKYLRLSAATLGLAACSTPPAAPVPKAIASEVQARQSSIVVAPCIDVGQVREARVVDDRTIDFFLAGREVVRNTLPAVCPSLASERTFTYAAALTKLCAADAITILGVHNAHAQAASCRLGSFVPQRSQAK